MATIIETSGSQRAVQPANGTFFTYEEIRSIIGGSIDTHSVRDEEILFFFADSPLPRNLTAMELAGIEIKPDMGEDDYIHGTALLCKPTELKNGQRW